MVSSFARPLDAEGVTAHRRDRGGVLSAAVVLGAAAVTLPLTLTEGDAAEWLVIARYGGIPHPSGYPLYALLARLFATLSPALPLVTAVALLSAFCAAGAAWLSYVALRRLGFERLVALVATLGIFLSSSVWRLANMPEPFALNLLLAALVLLLAAQTYAARRERAAGRAGLRVLLVGWAFGLGFCNHHSLALLAPLGLYAALAAGLPLGRMLVRLAAGFAAGLAPMLYLLFARGDRSPYDYYPLDSWHDLLSLLFRGPYGTFRLARTRVEANWDSVLYYFSHLPAWLSVLLLAVALVGVWALAADAVKGPERQRRWLSLAWAASFALASVVFLRLFNVRVESWIPSVIERLMGLATFLLLLPMAWGARVCVRLLARVRPGLPVLCAAVVLPGHAYLQSLRADRVHETFYEEHVRRVSSIADDAGGVLVTASDAEALGAMHARHILKLGAPDFLWLNASHWKSKRFRSATVRSFGLPDDARELSLTRFVALLLERRGRVVVADPPLPPRPSLFAHSFVVGPVTVLVRRDLALPSMDELWAMNTAFYGTASLPSGSELAALSPWDRALLQKYLDNLAGLARLFENEGRVDLADAARRQLRAISPPTPPAWRQALLP